MSLFIDINQNQAIQNQIKYIFLTGGFDSTFCLIYYLLFSSDDTFIQPIYIIDNCVDGIKNIFGYCNGRQNVQKEINTINIIYNKIYEKYPNYFHKLLNIVFIDNIILDNDIIQYSEESYKLGLGTRKINQYSYIAQICKSLNIIGIVSIIYEKNDSWNKIIYPTINKNYMSNKFNLYKNMQFPLINKSKKELYYIATCLNFNDILNLTFSCWFPKDDKPCGICNMCKERII